MLSAIEYKIFKLYIEKHKNNLSVEYMLDILILLKPKNKKNIEITNDDKKRIGIILIKVEKILSNQLDLKDSYIINETIKLFKIIWRDGGELNNYQESLLNH